jgi:hypothetical protein
MTAQEPDIFVLEGEEYQLIGIEGTDMPSPLEFGMFPVEISTACYRGFISRYEFAEGQLFLVQMELRDIDDRYLPICGVEPQVGKWSAYYRGLRVAVPFTGTIRLARDFIEERYVHMGFQRPTSYKTVLDLTLEEGKIKNTNDRSADVAELRAHPRRRPPVEGLLTGGITRSFSLTLDLD